MSAVPSTLSLRISVVIPTYRRTVLLRRCLNALLAQRFDRSTFEIVVVDDARSAVTQSSIQAYARRLHDRPVIRYFHPPYGARGPAAARNAGWRAAVGEIVAFTDDDAVPAQDWLSEGVATMANGVAATWGRILVPLPPNPTDWERNTAKLEGAEFVTANCFVRREVLAAAGGFDERFTRPWREDADLYFTLLERQWQVVQAPRAVVVHPVRPAPPAASIAQQRNMFYDALLYKKHRDLYREKIAATPPVRYYTAVAALVVAALALLTAHTGIAAIAFGIWLALTIEFVLRRLRGTSKSRRHVIAMIFTSAAIPILAVYWRIAGAVHFRVLFG
jgi:glycosyltransferase involved in cell wall biosynthesis